MFFLSLSPSACLLTTLFYLLCFFLVYRDDIFSPCSSFYYCYYPYCYFRLFKMTFFPIFFSNSANVHFCYWVFNIPNDFRQHVYLLSLFSSLEAVWDFYRLPVSSLNHCHFFILFTIFWHVFVCMPSVLADCHLAFSI